MKNQTHWLLKACVLAAFILSVRCEAQPSAENLSKMPSYPAQSNRPEPVTTRASSTRFGIVNTKRCLEESKLGKQEQANFEKMKKQMESVLQEKEVILEEVENKLNDDDYMDSISDEAAAELRNKRRSIRNEGTQLQNQYLHTLQQANGKIIQRLNEAISKASAAVAKESSTINDERSFDAILTDEACTYFSPELDVSDQVIAKMNQIFEEEQKNQKNP
jgi:outer membrane protein